MTITTFSDIAVIRIVNADLDVDNGRVRYDTDSIQFIVNANLDVNNGKLYADRTTGNIGIGTNSPQGPLDIQSNSDGVIVPQLSQAEINSIGTPAPSTLLFNTSTDQLMYGGRFVGVR